MRYAAGAATEPTTFMLGRTDPRSTVGHAGLGPL